MPPKSQTPSLPAAEKRRRTLIMQKLEEQAQLRKIEAAGKPQRTAMTKALGNAAWIGAAPVGPRKRCASPGAEDSQVSAKKSKTPSTGSVKSTSVKGRSASAKGGAVSRPAVAKRYNSKTPARRPAAVIPSDEEVLSDEDSDVKEPESEDPASDHSTPELEGNEDEEDQELYTLSRHELKKRFRLECPQWDEDASSLDDYSTGVRRKTEFNAELYEDVYRSHMAMLAAIRENSPNGYHRLMADLYDCTSSISTHLATTTTSNDDMALLNMVDMDV